MEWTNLEIFLSILILVITSAFAFFIGKYLSYNKKTQYQTTSNTDRTFEKANFDELLKDMRENDYFATKMDNSYKEGFDRGCKETMKLFTIELTEIRIIHEGWLKTKLTAGYKKQLHYNGLPIGSPETIIKYEHVKITKSEVEKLIDLVKEVINETAKIYASRGFNIIKNMK